MPSAIPQHIFREEMLPNINWIGFHFTSKKTGKLIQTPSGGSQLVNNFLRQKGIYSTRFTSRHRTSYNNLYLVATPESVPIQVSQPTIGHLLTPVYSVVQLPWNYVNTTPHRPDSEAQAANKEYLFSGRLNLDLASLTSGKTWDVFSSISIFSYYSPTADTYGYTRNCISAEFIFGIRNSPLYSFAHPFNLTIAKIIV